MNGQGIKENMERIPVIAFAGYSGSGKTTLIERLITRLKAEGYRVAAVKHDGHSFGIDYEGKDSWRFTRAGSDVTVIASEEQTIFLERGKLPIDRVLGKIHNVDLILVEGYKNEPLPQIGVARKETGKGFTADFDRFIALATDLKVESDLPCFDLDDIDGLFQFIRDWIKKRVG